MRHGIAGNRLSRNSSLRKATLRDLAKATLIAQRICTTKAKAKEARKLVERLITMGKSGALADKRRAFAILCDHQLVSDLFNETAPRFKNRLGGYTRIINLSNRRGDNAKLVFLELTEKKVVVVTPPKSKAKAQVKTQPTKAITHEQTVDVEDAPKAKEHTTKDAVKSESKDAVTQDKANAGKKTIIGGIRKMFNRKAPGQ